MAPNLSTGGLATGWTRVVTTAGAFELPGQVVSGEPVTLPLQLSDVGDDRDVWLRHTIAVEAETKMRLRLAGVGPLAEIFLDGERVASTCNLFRSYVVPLSLGAGAHDLVVYLPSPAKALSAKRPRPRWKTRLVAQQQLRYLRTSLLGRIPSWAADDAPRGVLGALSLTDDQTVTRDDVQLDVRLENGQGVVQVRLPPWAEIDKGTLRVGEHSTALTYYADGWYGRLTVDKPALWWPHTHGAQSQLPASLDLDAQRVDLGQVGFRSVLATTDAGRFALRVNGEAIFCRGAVFVPQGIDPALSVAALKALRNAGGNMVRIGGTMRYEPQAFFDACDALGILVWQDFMFANMDYPVDDDAFHAEVVAEVDEQLHRWSAHPSVVVLCGGSEVAQQASMVGQPSDRWYGSLFENVLPGRCATILPSVPYVMGSPSSPLDGDGKGHAPPLPFRVDRGVAHYYGVGAYLRPFEDARRANVTFASECLGLSNVPEPHAVENLFGDDPITTHTPRWKAGVPRDNGAGWDFEDVRDHYLEVLFGQGAREVRYADPEKYLELSRITSVEVMTRVFSEWRRSGSATHGGLVWFLRDLEAGAGWGLLDVHGSSKAPLLALPRVWSPTALLFTDEGSNGLRLHVVHDGPTPRTLQLRVALYRGSESLVAETQCDVIATPRSAVAYDVEGLFGGFRDVGWSYRFGPRAHDALIAQLCDESGELVGEAAHLDPISHSPPDPHLSAVAVRSDERTIHVTVRAQRLAHWACVRIPGWRAECGYFHVAPNSARVVTLRAEAATPAPAKGDVHALGAAPVRVSVA